MSWNRDNLWEASFRAVPFHVDGATTVGGRRVVTHEFPHRDDPVHEDLGRLPRLMEVEALLVSADVLRQVAALEAALEAPGAGTLIHPWLGTLRAVAREFRTSYATKTGRMARIAIRFERSPEVEPSPVIATDSAAAIEGAVDAVWAALAEAADAALTFVGQADWVIAELASAMVWIADTLATACAAYGYVVSGQILIDLAAALPPAGLILPMIAAFRAVGTAGSGATVDPRVWTPSAGVPTRADRQALLALLAVAEGPPVPLPAAGTATPARRRLAAAGDALVVGVRAAAATGAAQVARGLKWRAKDEALADRARIGAALDVAADGAAAAGWDGLWGALTDLRAASAAHIARVAAPLPGLRTLQVAAPIPSSLAAYRLAGDDLTGLWSRAEDIVARNRISHPAFVPALTALEVLDG